MGLKSKIRSLMYILSNVGLSTTRWNFVKRGGVMGKGCVIYPNVEFGSEPYLIELGDYVRITNGVRFVTHDGGLWVLRNLKQIDRSTGKFGRIKIGNNVHIGWNAIIMPGVTIGNNCIIGCGAVVTKDIPDNSVAVGVPAKVIETLEEYSRKVIDGADIIAENNEAEKRRYLTEKYMNK